MAAGTGSSAALLCFLAFLSAFSSSRHVSKYEYYVTATPLVLRETLSSTDVVRCARVPVFGLSRLKLGSYFSANRITFAPSHLIQGKSYEKIQICLHRNSSLGLCQCENHNWEGIQNGIWSSVVSPYENRYIDVKFVNNLYGSVTIRAKLEFYRWSLLCLAIGLVVFLLVPVVSSWAPFYNSSSMDIGVCFVVIILLFQSTLDTPLAMAVLTIIVGSSLSLYYLKWHYLGDFTYSADSSPSIISPSSHKSISSSQEYYSTFHKIPNRSKFTKEEQKDFKKEYTRLAPAELKSSPECIVWSAENAKEKQIHCRIIIIMIIMMMIAGGALLLWYPQLLSVKSGEQSSNTVFEKKVMWWLWCLNRSCFFRGPYASKSEEMNEELCFTKSRHLTWQYEYTGQLPPEYLEALTIHHKKNQTKIDIDICGMDYSRCPYETRALRNDDDDYPSC